MHSSLRLMLPCLLLIAVSLVGAAAHAQSRRGVPRAIRRALVGCWQPWPGERWRIERHGATGLRVSFRLDAAALAPRFGRITSARQRSDTLSYRPDRETVQMSCGPTTQHGQFCVLSWDGSELRVALYARGHSRRARSRLVDVVTATRCSAR